MFSAELYNSVLTKKITNKTTKYQIKPYDNKLEDFLDYTIFMVEGYANYFGWDYEKEIDAKILVLLNNLAYIPYGLVGYNAMQCLLVDISVEEFRYIKIQQILGEIYIKLSQEQKDYIKDFFYNYNCSQVETDSKKDIVSLFCRISCELEFALKKYDKDFLKEKLLEIGNLIIADAEKYFSLSPAVFLKLVSINKELTKEELQRLKTFV